MSSVFSAQTKCSVIGLKSSMVSAQCPVPSVQCSLLSVEQYLLSSHRGEEFVVEPAILLYLQVLAVHVLEGTVNF